MPDLFAPMKRAAEAIDRALLFFSTGKDSIVMLDLFQRFMPGRFVPVYFYFVKDLEFQEVTLRYYENRFGIQIERRPHWDVSAYTRKPGDGRRLLKAADAERFVRAEYDLSWIAQGERADESVQRRGHLMQYRDDAFLDFRNKKFYPVADWRDKHIFAYIKARKLVLPVEYQFGYRNIDQFKGPAVLWIRNNYPADYEKIVAEFPQVKAEALRLEMKS